MTSPDGSAVSQRADLPPVFLNHVCIFLDAITYKDVEQSAFLREVFAITELRTTSMNGKAHTALYFYGENTYFEFFNAADLPSTGVGHGGIALGVDRPGDLQKIYKALKLEFVVEANPVVRQWGEKQVPWFYAGARLGSSGTSKFPVWLMEYHPRFLADWHPQPDSRNEGVRREQVLQRYIAVLRNVPTAPLFKDVIGLAIATDEAVRKNLTEFAELLGYAKDSLGDTEILNGPDLELRFIPRKNSRGVQALTLLTDKQPKKQTEFRFGPTSTLRFHGEGFATWSFA